MCMRVERGGNERRERGIREAMMEDRRKVFVQGW